MNFVHALGLCNASVTFWLTMDVILTDLKWAVCFVFLDGMAVFFNSFDEQLPRLSLVLNAIRQAGLLLQPKNCSFAMRELNFLGHIIDTHGIQTDPKKTAAIECFSQPLSVTNVSSFLGLAGYYRKFIKGFAKIAEPLFTLTKKEQMLL